MSQPNDYPIFVHWYKTLNWILDRVDRLPKHLRFTLSGRIANLALDIQSGRDAQFRVHMEVKWIA